MNKKHQKNIGLQNSPSVWIHFPQYMFYTTRCPPSFRLNDAGIIQQRRKYCECRKKWAYPLREYHHSVLHSCEPDWTNGARAPNLVPSPTASIKLISGLGTMFNILWWAYATSWEWLMAQRKPCTTRSQANTPTFFSSRLDQAVPCGSHVCGHRNLLGWWSGDGPPPVLISWQQLLLAKIDFLATDISLLRHNLDKFCCWVSEIEDCLQVGEHCAGWL